MLERILRFFKRFIPKKLFALGQPVYHYLLVFAGALVYRFPSRHIKVVAVTGTKGKSTTVELVAQILQEAGYITAVLSTLHFVIGNIEERNLYKMTLPGRFFVQRFLRRAVAARCDWVVLEMTSEGAKQFRHKFVDLDALIFTNLSPEHIESHGSFENYRDAKRTIGRALAQSNKPIRYIVANADDAEGGWYLNLRVPRVVPFSLEQAKPFTETNTGVHWTLGGTLVRSPLYGSFNLYNQLAAAHFALSVGIGVDVVRRALQTRRDIRGRVEFIQHEPFRVVVDYAHTPDSLAQFYGIFKDSKNICVLGNTGGGRDTWKRPEMARIAEKNCHHIILTNEDPYDEDPHAIVDEMAEGITNTNKLEIILDRRAAIRAALLKAREGDAVLITGKGTDPFIMGPNGSREPWDDATIVREELKSLSR